MKPLSEKQFEEYRKGIFHKLQQTDISAEGEHELDIDCSNFVGRINFVVSITDTSDDSVGFIGSDTKLMWSDFKATGEDSELEISPRQMMLLENELKLNL